MATDLSRSSLFPPSFLFGVASSSVQIEGATSEGGRGKGIWDTFASIPGKILDGSTPKVTCDFFHKFQEDILEMKRLGVESYRFSISWPRLFPETSEFLNKEGLAFYNKVLDCLLEAGLTPFVTLYHWDLPQYLQDDPEVKGWLTTNIIDHFLNFANTCFTYFGDRVKHWITFNEIHMGTILSCELGMIPPGNSSEGRSDSYIVAHHSLLAHAAAVELYREKYQKEHRGFIGMSADVTWFEPMSDRQGDIDAAVRCEEFGMGWILDPVFFGDYPKMMRELVGERLPRFTEKQSRDLKGSLDFLGLNYYFVLWATQAADVCPGGLHVWLKESQTNFHWINADGKLLGEAPEPHEQAIFRSCPWGIRKALAALKSRYGDIPIYITENGTTDGDMDATLDEPYNDKGRVKFLQEHLRVVSESIREDNVNVKGYFYWTFMDNWEWMSGFTSRFGLYHVDFQNPQLSRIPKASAKWFSAFLKS
ncbi:hypothetical protein L7F22_006632 [Adiantum nelumboides]|nr:hypothetical protein [Adiantum nelumboides]